MTEHAPQPTDRHDEEGDSGYEPFLSVLHRALRGEVLDLAGDRLAEVVRAVEETGKNGSVTLTVNLKPNERLGVVEVSGAVKASKPEPDFDPRMMWPLPDGRLSTRNPNQMTIDQISPVE